ncbi:Queuine tRNA-ribosyltransferase [Fomitiporia mediterranea MF3/22]|uniref:Queuine tRNA-ribosyltransferase n=1 Tax=Fomitiporia mediterranea (strain MF3/22) TaxID=694068 RepID=UPI0004408070|nr:Queuine tRNA-ribosyltransferase [Fomitiporia mediterranea MF3/22]EJD03313.1 Queuine tRNA-ribosyltransferase [Fomitiporia mediterranea MF3/22]
MQFEIIAKCPVTKARVTKMTLAHGPTMLPTFMPVATQAAIKGLTSHQLEAIGITLILNNTYHLNLRPGIDVLDAAGGAHKLQGWKRNLLTDSGGFQLVSLSQFTKITEEGALFASPFTGEPTMLSPEQSMAIQHSIGADIIMQLDDVVPSLLIGPRVEEAMWRSVRWLDRCITFHEESGKNKTQNLFAIVQGGLDTRLRELCLEEMIKRKEHVPGYAVGGLSGGEAKDDFWRVVNQCTDMLPVDRPRYCMGIGFAEDLLVCVALGIDMADCVFPTRTARFGVALTYRGPLNLRLAKHAKDLQPIDRECPCPTCAGGMTRAFLHHLVAEETVAAHAVTQHNITFQAQLMGRARDAIVAGTFPDFLRTFFRTYFDTDFRSTVAATQKPMSGEDIASGPVYPKWCVDALRSVGVDILEGVPNAKIIDGGGAKWEYAATDG